ncbi:hypothetical protein M3212_13415 [Alkalihalobacillus oceani]|uniref:hypothetical protein n=1 Tax=Halalkalibacter oceani TaxID=1653776 RepID=UPI0020419DEC|nr:hypothetical protein [Halalkalibacter oceani]MCM3761771.1 hypothetical protein [Halalkalibacter oceani]
MRILVCEELTNDLRVNIEKIKDMSEQLEKNNYEAFFVYSFALFESSICEALRRILAAFPEKLTDEKQPKLKNSDIFNNMYSSNYILETIINAEIKSISKGNALALLQTAQNLMAIELTFDRGALEDVSKYRNRLAHDNTISNREYLLGRKTVKGNTFSFEIAKILIDTLTQVLSDFEVCLKTKYKKYTKFKLIKDLWEEIFNTPLLKFEDCIVIRQDVFDKNKSVVGINFDHLKTVVKSISSGEKFFLSLLLQQYSSNINDQYFKFKDIPSLASKSSNTRINKILRVFDIYPNLFNGVRIDGAT